MKSTHEVVTLGEDVATLQQQVDSLRASVEEAKKEEKKQINHDTTAAQVSSDEPVEPPMLISLDSPTDEQQHVSASIQYQNLDTSNQSLQQTSYLVGDGLVLSNPMSRDTCSTESDILQPEVLVTSKPTADSEHQNNNDNNIILQQSQELF